MKPPAWSLQSVDSFWDIGVEWYPAMAVFVFAYWLLMVFGDDGKGTK